MLEATLSNNQKLKTKNFLMSDFWTQVLDFAQTITAQVGTRLLQDFGHVWAAEKQAAEKADGSLVTQSDRWADEVLRKAIAQAFPDHGVLSEEVEHIFPANDWCWIVDPLDGTTNFARGLPIWGISLGLLYKGTPVFGYATIGTILSRLLVWYVRLRDADRRFFERSPHPLQHRPTDLKPLL